MMTLVMEGKLSTVVCPGTGCERKHLCLMQAMSQTKELVHWL